MILFAMMIVTRGSRFSVLLFLLSLERAVNCKEKFDLKHFYVNKLWFA